MTEPDRHPNLQDAFAAGHSCRARAWVGVWLAVWLLWLAADWAGRFGMFRWQDVWMPSRAPAGSPSRSAAAVRTLPAQTGAGLTQMLPFSGMAARYAEFHPETVQPRDPWGYFNASPTAEGYCPVVMVGDSFMVSLGTQTVAQALAAVGAVRVYNHARPGTGPFLELRRFIASARFEPPPQVVVWNLTARELGAPLFRRQAVAAWFDRSLAADATPGVKQRPGILWDHLAPAALREAWPNTSLAAYFSRKAWRKIKLGVFREWPAEVLGADDPEFGPMLFYGENLRVLPLLGPETDASAVMRTVEHVARGLRDRGTALVVLLVPEKEQVHAEALPVRHRRALADSTDLLDAIAAGLSEAGVPVVNLMPVFREATETGQRLYWRDDTHWNDAGIRLAAEELWREVEPLLEENQESISNIQHPISSAAEPQPK